MAATIGKELTAGLTVPSGFWFDSRARSEQATLVLQTQTSLQALTNVLAWLQVRTKGQR
ncbi:MAG: hypothetical protein HY303_00720 [Candidatus Wallbacteria bacterium]|nr:hypothetical protein [Candidatus Wallbacteria bacterium]